MHNRQTISFLQRRLDEIGIRPDARRGQNFLVDLNLLELLVESADLQPEDIVLEIGTGTGSLTAKLAERAGDVITVEVDSRLQQLASEELRHFSNIRFLQQDVLHNKNHFHPNVLREIDEIMSISPRPLKLVSNLPYSIATPVISNLFCTKHVPTRMAVTIQKELADRVVASPGTKDYGSLSVWVQSQAEAEIVRILPPTVFWPRPKVHSAFLRIDTNPAKRALLDPLEAFHTFVRAMFFHRRKFLRSVMLSAYKGELGKPEVDQIMLRQGLGPDSRAEQLNVQEMLALFHTTQQELAAHASSHSPIDGDKS